MKIQFYNPVDFNKPIRVSVHRTGRISFTKEASTKLGLDVSKTVDIGYNTEDETDKSLYLAVKPDLSGKFKVGMAGAYYYIGAEDLLNEIKMPYSNGELAFEMTKVTEDGSTFFRFNPKEVKADERQE